MARNSATKSRSNQKSIPKRSTDPKKTSNVHNNGKKRGPEENEVLRTKPMHEVHHVTGLSFDDEEDPVASTAWVTQRGKKNEAKKDDRVPEIVVNPTVETKSMNCCGSSMRMSKRRFKEIKDKEAILAAGYHMFDNKPLIVRPWQVDVDLLKEDVKIVPAWVRLHGLPLKFWGKCLPSIAGLVGKYIKKDAATDEKTRLGFARTMVELTVGQNFPNSVKFKDEQGKVVVVNVEYEWKPSICTKCKSLGHEEKTCRKVLQKGKPTQKVWKPVPKPAINDNKLSETEYPVLNAANGTPGKIQVTPSVSTQEKLAYQGGKSDTMQESPQVVVVDVSDDAATQGGIEATIVQYDPQFIHVKVIIKSTQKSFFLSMIYAYNEGVDRKDLWAKMERIAAVTNGPWVMAGDFNTVISPDERMGGNTKQEDMDDFIDCITTCGMNDIHATGAYFTWTNKQDAAHRKFSRLDRFMVNHDWMNTFPEMAAHFHPEGLLDHNPCVVSISKMGGRKNASFKYFNMWSSLSDFRPKFNKNGRAYRGDYDVE
ncbi:uncharacterized protein LOC141649398 [Silene latifolia]|uniref:uncharacterized protein LOC141649398 n=1 Tax=Silene latifolia TaxID=37657 RepID=UPI003D783849